jgi:aryl-alcohol dehydrogenase-like predicted oxidoreductase
MSLRWILDQEAVTMVIPGASSPDQARKNAKASELSPLQPNLHSMLDVFYRRQVHCHIRGPY